MTIDTNTVSDRLEVACLILRQVGEFLEKLIETPLDERLSAIIDRCKKPAPGDMVVETSSKRESPVCVGVLVKIIESGESNLFVVRELYSGEQVAWGSREWFAIPTKLLQKEFS